MQQLMEARLRGGGDVGENVGQPDQRIDVVELGRCDQRGHGRGPRSAVCGAFRALVRYHDRHHQNCFLAHSFRGGNLAGTETSFDIRYRRQCVVSERGSKQSAPLPKLRRA